MIGYWSNSRILVKWSDTGQIIGYWSNGRILDEFSDTGRMVRYWSNNLFPVKFFDTGQTISSGPMVGYWLNGRKYYVVEQWYVVITWSNGTGQMVLVKWSIPDRMVKYRTNRRVLVK